MKLVTWNLNGLKSSLKNNLKDFIKETKADIYCFQEIKISKKDLEKLTKELKIGDYQPYFYLAVKNGYSGLLTYSKICPNYILEGIGNEEFDQEARVLTLEFDELFVVNAYFPHTGRELARLPYKLKFNREFEKYVKSLNSRKPVLIAGDFNVAHKDIDLKNPKENQFNAGFTIQEREWFDGFLKLGFTDTFRCFDKSKEKYTWWSYRKDVRKKNIGWRIDYFIASKELKNRLKSCKILSHVLGSDHAPVEMKLII